VRFVIGFIKFWYDFIIGDDWTIAVAVVIALSVTHMLIKAQIPVSWLMPVAVLLFLGISIWRAKRS
jgi:hypothetical protein